MNGLSTGEQKQALHHRTGEAALLHQSLSTGPGAVYPSHTPILTTTEELWPILTTGQCLYGNNMLLPQGNSPSVNPETSRLDTQGRYLQFTQVTLRVLAL